MSSDRERLRGSVAYRVHLIVGEERARLARRRPDLAEADLAEVEAMLWRIADTLVLCRDRWEGVDPAAVARLWE